VRVSIDGVLQNAVESGAVPNVAAIAADRDGIVYEGAAGPRVAGETDPVTVETHFRIMPMTKMVATVAALQLMERGALDFDAPVAQYCPEWGGPAGARGLRRRQASPPSTGVAGDGEATRHPHQRTLLLVLETTTSSAGRR
jgi:CubicO group peptidase (beta-lactamase class C family)